MLVEYEDEFRIYDIQGRLKNRIKSTYQTGYVTYSPTGKYILSSGWYNGRAYLWNKSGLRNSIFSFDSRSQGIKYAVFSPDERYVLIQTEMPDESRNGISLGLWDLDGTKITEFQNLYTESYPVYSSFSPDGQYVLIAYSDGMLRIFPTPKRIYQYLAEESPYSTISDLTGFGIR